MAGIYSDNVVKEIDGQKIGYDGMRHGMTTRTLNTGFFPIISGPIKIKKIHEITKIGKSKDNLLPGTDFRIVLSLLEDGRLLFSKMTFQMMDGKEINHQDGQVCTSYQILDFWVVDVFVYLLIPGNLVITCLEWIPVLELRILLALAIKDPVVRVEKDARTSNTHSIIVIRDALGNEILKPISADTIRKLY